MELPRASFGSVEFRYDGTSHHFEAVSHAGEQPIELIIAELDPA